MVTRNTQTSEARLSRRSNRVVLAALLACLLLPMGQSLQAQSYSGGNATLAQQAASAHEQLRLAQARLDELEEKLRSKLVATDPKWAAMQRAIDGSSQRSKELKMQILEQTRASAEHQSAQRKLAEAEAQVRQLTDARDTMGKAFQQASDTIWNTRMRIRRMEQSALNSSNELRTIEAERVHTEKELAAQWESYVATTLSQNPSWTAAVTARDNAAQAVKLADQALGARGQQQISHSRSSTSHRTSNSSNRSSRSRSSSSHRSNR